MGIFVAPIVAAFLMCGCGGGKHRTINVAAGEYYTEDEIVQLSEGRHSEYCSDLESQRAVVQGQFEALTAEVARTSDAITAARKRQDDLERQLLAVESDLRTLDDQLEEVRALPTTWKVRPGESLSSISALPEIYNDVDKWWKLYEVNKDKVPDPYFCFPDTVIVIPRDWPVD
jgi:nucleoid-associated protein YgaU